MRTLPFALLLLACSEAPHAEPAGPAAELPTAATDEAALLSTVDGADPDAVMRYFSGNLPNLMNHPAIHWTRGSDTLFVSGRGALERFPAADLDRALDRYRALLVERGYEPEGTPPREPQTGMVFVPMSDLFPSESEAQSLFTPEQLTAIRNLRPTTVWHHLAGRDGSRHDRVVMYASSAGLAILSRTTEETIPMSSASQAFTRFRALMSPQE